jgi:hypothetical protein
MSDSIQKKVRDRELAFLMTERREFIREQKIAGWHRRRHDRRVSSALCPDCKIALGEWRGDWDEADGILRAMERARVLPPVYARLRNGVA